MVMNKSRNKPLNYGKTMSLLLAVKHLFQKYLQMAL